MLRSISDSLCLVAGLLGLFSSACSFTFDHEAQDILVVGEAYDQAALLRFSGLQLAAPYSLWERTPDQSVPLAHLLAGLDGAPWLAWQDQGTGIHLQRLASPEVTHTYSSREWKYDQARTTLTVIKEAESSAQPAQVHFLPIGKVPVSTDLPIGDTHFEYDDHSVFSWGETELHLLRRSGSTLERYSFPWRGPFGLIRRADNDALFLYGPRGQEFDFAPGVRVVFLPHGKPPINVPLPEGDTQAAYTDQAVLSWAETAATRELHLLRLRADTTIERRNLPWLGHVSYLRTLNPAAGADLFYFAADQTAGVIDLASGNILDGLRVLLSSPEYLVYASSLGELYAYSVALRQAGPLGVSYTSNDRIMPLAESAFLICNSSGVQRVTLRAPGLHAEAQRLTTQPCEGVRLASRESVEFRSGAGLYELPLDGSTPPRLLQSLGSDREPPENQQVSPDAILAMCGAQTVARASRAAEPEDWGATDGFIADWQFMERGREVSFSPDCDRVRWKEHAAREDGLGQLLSAEVPRGKVLRLARNVAWYQGLHDGRVLSTANMTEFGPQNRVLLIDEARQEARLLLQGKLWPYSLRPLQTVIPGNGDVLLQIYNGDQIPELLLLPLPPRQM